MLNIEDIVAKVYARQIAAGQTTLAAEVAKVLGDLEIVSVVIPTGTTFNADTKDLPVDVTIKTSDADTNTDRQSERTRVIRTTLHFDESQNEHILSTIDPTHTALSFGADGVKGTNNAGTATAT